MSDHVCCITKVLALKREIGFRGEQMDLATRTKWTGFPLLKAVVTLVRFSRGKIYFAVSFPPFFHRGIWGLRFRGSPCHRRFSSRPMELIVFLVTQT